MTRTEAMTAIAENATALLHALDERNITIEVKYSKPSNEVISKLFTEWQILHYGIVPDEEYFEIYGDFGRSLLYVIEASWGSPISAAADLMDFLSRKF